MVKAYLRYEAANTFGVVASTAGNMLTDHAGKLLISPALEATHVWNPKTGALVRPRSERPAERVMSAHARRRRLGGREAIQRACVRRSTRRASHRTATPSLGGDAQALWAAAERDGLRRSGGAAAGANPDAGGGQQR